MLVAPLAGWLGGRIGSKLPLQLGTAIAAAAFVFLALVHDEPWSIYVGTALLGLGIGLSFASMANLIVEAVDQRHTGVATGINTIMRLIGGSIGGQVAASIVAGHIAGDGAARGVRIHRRVRDVGRRGGRGLRARVLDPWPPSTGRGRRAPRLGDPDQASIHSFARSTARRHSASSDSRLVHAHPGLVAARLAPHRGHLVKLPHARRDPRQVGSPESGRLPRSRERSPWTPSTSA